MVISKSIIYVNYAPYENAGYILDYLLSKYKLVVLFSLSFHSLGKNNISGTVAVYYEGKLKTTSRLLEISGPNSLIFLILPLKSLLVLLQVFFWSFRYKQKYGKFDYYFTVNAYTSWIGNLLRRFNIVNFTIFWVWDYYPPIHKNKLISFIRWIYWQFDKRGIDSNNILFMNKRLINLRKAMGGLPKTASYPIVPIGTKPIQRYKKYKGKNLNLVFLGVLKRSQGLDLFLNCALKSQTGNIRLHIIGTGPDEKYFKSLCVKNKLKVKFWGYIKDEKQIDRIISSCDIGLATYIPEEGNVSYYGDPSKIKRYLGFSLPVITTNVFNFAQEIKTYNAGIVINYNDNEMLQAIRTINDNFEFYSKNALSLAKKYRYTKIYNTFFK